MQYTQVKNIFLPLVSILLMTQYGICQDEQKKPLSIEYGIPLFTTVSEENFDNLNINNSYNTNIMFGGGLFVGNPHAFFVSGDMSVNYEIFNAAAYIKQVTISGAVNYNINPNNHRYAITPFLGTLFGYSLGTAEIYQRWLIHCGIIVDYIFAKEPQARESIFVKAGYNIHTYASEWTGLPQSYPYGPKINMGGPFITIGMAVWNK